MEERINGMFGMAAVVTETDISIKIPKEVLLAWSREVAVFEMEARVQDGALFKVEAGKEEECIRYIAATAVIPKELSNGRNSDGRYMKNANSSPIERMVHEILISATEDKEKFLKKSQKPIDNILP